MAAIVLPPPSLPRLGELRPRLGTVGRTAGARRGATTPTAPTVVPGRPSAATYRRRRLVALALLVTVLAGAWAAGSAAWSAVAGAVAVERATPATEVGPVAVAAVPVAQHVYVVKPGDTLWAIARTLQPEGDVRPLVDRLAERNGGSRLEAGQRLSLDGLVP